MHRSVRHHLHLLVALLVACGLFATGPATPASADTREPRATRTITKTVNLRKPGEFSSHWTRTQKVTYGAPASKLGTSPGGDGVSWGPSYGVQVRDKTWWYVDAAKGRLAHYSDKGKYLDQVKLPRSYLAQGVYFQWANPVALSDGTVALSSTSIDSPALLLLSPKKKLSKVKLARFVNVVISDGTYLYGFDENGKKVRVSPKTGAIKKVSQFKGQGGKSFDISLRSGLVTVTRPGIKAELKLASSDYRGETIHPTIEAAMASDGTLWILITGFVELSPSKVKTVIGLLSVDAKGKVSEVARVPRLDSTSDPADGHHLGIRFGDTRPTLMFVGTKDVRVYRR